jgi:hypothetical protein
MPPLAIPIALSAISTIPQWIAGYNQGNRADQLARNLVRPEFEIPESAKRALASAEAQSQMARLPGQDAIEGRLDQTTANKIAMIERMSMGGPTAINAAGSAYGQQMDAENQLGVEAANMRLRNQEILRNQLGQMSQWENQKWSWDKRLPFEQTAAAIEALREGSMRNKNAAWKDIFGSAANISLMAGMGGNEEGGNWLSKIFGGGNNSTTPGTGSIDLSTGVSSIGLPATSQFKFSRPNVLDSNGINK